MQDLYNHTPVIPLLPCPFCGAAPKVEKVGMRLRISCPTCFTSQGIYPEEFAYDKWQRRTEIQEITTLRNRLAVLQGEGMA